MDLTTVLFTHLQPNSNSIGLDSNALDDALDASLAAFTADIKAAVPSYLGIQLTIRQSRHPVTLTRITPHRPATTSLRVPLTVLEPRFDPDSRVTLYATTAGAFVDLAADLNYTLHLHTPSDRSTDAAGSSDSDDRRHGQLDSERRITLDADVPPSPLASGMSGLSELSTINQAIGVLIGHGHHPDHAGDTLRRDATSQGLKPHSYAARLLGRDQPDRDTGSTTSGGDARRQQPLPEPSSTDHRAFHRLDQRAGPPPEGMIAGLDIRTSRRPRTSGSGKIVPFRALGSDAGPSGKDVGWAGSSQ